MEQDMKEQTTSPMPVIPRLDRLDHLLQSLEEKHSLSRRDFSAYSNNSVVSGANEDCKTLSSALVEVQHKGTLLDRLALLEDRVLKLALEIDEGKLSSSTAEESELSIVNPSTLKKMQYITAILTQEEVSTDGGSVKHIDNSTKGKRRKKWLGLFRPRFTC